MHTQAHTHTHTHARLAQAPIDTLTDTYLHTQVAHSARSQVPEEELLVSATVATSWWRHQASRGRPRPLPSRPSPGGRGSMWSPPTFPNQVPFVPRPGLGGGHRAWGSPSHRVLWALLGLTRLGPGDELGAGGPQGSEMADAEGQCQHRMAATRRESQPTAQGTSGRTVQPPGPSRACSPSPLPIFCPRIC